MPILGNLNTSMGPMINSVSHAVGQAARQASNNLQAPAPQAPGATLADLQRRIAALEAQVAALTAALSVSPTGLTISVGGTVQINAGMIQLNAPMVRAPGVMQADTVICTSVVAASYTPGAGNVW